MEWLDFACLPMGLSYAIGRVGCFMNGCCYGKICLLPWGVQFAAHERWGMAVLPRHPTQAYAAGFEILSVALLATLESSKPLWLRRSGRLFLLWILLHSVNRVIMEHWRDDYRGALLARLSLATWISLALGLASLVLLSIRSPDAGPN